ncbi:MAG: ornithine carbamoyltransferase [Bifidobacteriaceae bacterium]|jgi:ornithine carbamoyltransferase|nr:ornithine carbamoyltransferase [Bifidobacteriaceae bacterium]
MTGDLTRRHFLRDDDVTAVEQRELLALALELKKDRLAIQPLAGPRAVAILFDKQSTRTRVSFAVSVAELGGYPLVIDAANSQTGRGESVEDTTRVLDRQCAAIVWRTFGQTNVERMAAVSRVPVINALTDQFHPCQVLADLMTLAEARGGIGGLPGAKLAYVGDGANNMAHSYLLACATAGMRVSIATPASHLPDPSVVGAAREIALENGGVVEVTGSPEAAVAGAHAVASDTWVSMGMESEAAEREAPFVDFQVTAGLMAKAAPDAIFLHCLPAYRGKEVTSEVIDGPASRVWDEAENRLHVQKALIAWLLEH